MEQSDSTLRHSLFVIRYSAVRFLIKFQGRKHKTTDNGPPTTDNRRLFMKITKDEVLYVADLARLELDDTAIEKYADQIDTILEYVDQLKAVDTEGVRPTSHAIFLTNAFREDEERTHLDRDQALANAPEKEEGNFVVPKVVG
jgi:aspartyl-tRNA(Asn)/glutamyl-tRNA(Gln) amidotransferase subunit C